MDPQTLAILQALSGSTSPSPGALSPFGANGPGASPGAAGGDYALPQDPVGMGAQPGATAPSMPGMPGDGQQASNGNASGLSMGTGAQPQGQPTPDMYGAMMQPPPVPNYWGQQQ